MADATSKEDIVLTEAQSPIFKTDAKDDIVLTWDNATIHNGTIICEEDRVDWSRTKYKGRKTNTPPNHFVTKGVPNYIYTNERTIPGIIAQDIFEIKDDIIPDFRKYNRDEIYKLSGGVLRDVKYLSDDRLEVIYKPYDHHNEPIMTSYYKLIKKS